MEIFATINNFEDRVCKFLQLLAVFNGEYNDRGSKGAREGARHGGKGVSKGGRKARRRRRRRREGEDGREGRKVKEGRDPGMEQ